MKATPAPPLRCDSCGARDPEPLARSVVAGMEVAMCVNPSACLNRARVARIGMWARPVVACIIALAMVSAVFMFTMLAGPGPSTVPQPIAPRTAAP